VSLALLLDLSKYLINLQRKFEGKKRRKKGAVRVKYMKWIVYKEHWGMLGAILQKRMIKSST
jgi:hypothetical protein